MSCLREIPPEFQDGENLASGPPLILSCESTLIHCKFRRGELLQCTSVCHRQHGGTVVSTVASQREGPGFESSNWAGPMCMGILAPPTVQRHAISGVRSTGVGVNMLITEVLTLKLIHTRRTFISEHYHSRRVTYRPFVTPQHVS